MGNFTDLRKKLAQERSSVPEFSVQLPYLKKNATFRAMKNKELKNFLKALEKKDEYLINEAFDRILDNCVVNVEGHTSFEPDNLTIQDRTYLLLQIRRESRGNIANFPHVIDGHDTPIEVEIDIDELLVEYKDEPVEDEIKIKDTSFTIVLGPPTRGDEKDMENWLKTHGAKNNMADRRYCSYATIIKQVKVESEDGQEVYNLTYDEKVKLISDHLQPSDIVPLTEFVEKELDFGVKLEFHCVSGDYENESEEINILSFFII